MKRKVSKIGPSTLMVSLPNKWVKQNNIKKGDELEVLEKGKSLNIFIDKIQEKKSGTFDVSNLDHMLYRFVGALYKAGFDKVKLVYKNHKQLETIYDVLNKVCIGYEITKDGNKFVIIEQISEVKEEDFEKVLRRLFQFLISVSEDGLKAIESNNRSLLKELPLRDYNVTRVADFCRRCLNKNQESFSGPLYYISEQLERIGDYYRDFFKEAFSLNGKLDKSTINYYKELNSFFADFYKLFYKFGHNDLEGFYKYYKGINELELKKDKSLIPYLYKIKSSIYEMNGALMVINSQANNS